MKNTQVKSYYCNLNWVLIYRTLLLTLLLHLFFFFLFLLLNFHHISPQFSLILPTLSNIFGLIVFLVYRLSQLCYFGLLGSQVFQLLQLSLSISICCPIFNTWNLRGIHETDLTLNQVTLSWCILSENFSKKVSNTHDTITCECLYDTINIKVAIN